MLSVSVQEGNRVEMTSKGEEPLQVLCWAGLLKTNAEARLPPFPPGATSYQRGRLKKGTEERQEKKMQRVESGEQRQRV